MSTFFKSMYAPCSNSPLPYYPFKSKTQPFLKKLAFQYITIIILSLVHIFKYKTHCLTRCSNQVKLHVKQWSMLKNSGVDISIL